MTRRCQTFVRSFVSDGAAKEVKSTHKALHFDHEVQSVKFTSARRCCVFLQTIRLDYNSLLAVAQTYFFCHYCVEDVAHMEKYRELFMTLNDWMSLWTLAHKRVRLTSTWNSYQRRSSLNREHWLKWKIFALQRFHDLNWNPSHSLWWSRFIFVYWHA